MDNGGAIKRFPLCRFSTEGIATYLYSGMIYRRWMRITQKAIIYTVSITAYLFLIIYNTLRKSDWAIDNLLSLSFLLIIYSLNSHIGLQRTALILLNIPLIFHNLGTFDWYSWNIWFQRRCLCCVYIDSFVLQGCSPSSAKGQIEPSNRFAGILPCCFVSYCTGGHG